MKKEDQDIKDKIEEMDTSVEENDKSNTHR